MVVAAPTPLIRLGRLADAGELWAKLEHLNTSGSIHDRVAARALAASSGRMVVVGGAPWCLALLAAAASAGPVEVVAVVVTGEPSGEEHALLRSATRAVGTDLALCASTAGGWRAQEAASRWRAAVVAQDASDAYRDTLGVELVDALTDRAVPVFVADDEHGAVGGLRAAGLRVVAVRRAPSAHTLDGLRAGAAADAVVVTDAQAQHTRTEAARREGLLVAHSAAAVLSAARSAAGGVRVAVLGAAGDRAFSRDLVGAV